MPTLSRTRRGRTIVARFNAMRDRHQPRLTRALQRHFRALAARVVTRYLAKTAQKAEGDELLPDSERQALEFAMRPLLEQIWRDSAELAGALVGVEPTIQLSIGGAAAAQVDPGLQQYLAQAGARVVGITEETRLAIQQVLVEGGERGYSTWQIANGVAKEDFRGLRDVVQETYRGRAETIARTELAIASQQSTHDTWADAGVTQVDIMDGPNCGWRRHSDPDKANGTRRSLGDAQQHPIAHPNCRRVSLPVLERL